VFARPGIGDLIRALGGDLFEDSLELNTNVTQWSPCLPAEFARLRGYPLATALPTLAGLRGKALASTTEFDYAGGIGHRIRSDYRQTPSDMYATNRLDTLRAWSHSWGCDSAPSRTGFRSTTRPSPPTSIFPRASRSAGRSSRTARKKISS
jgi:hypothetical protein